MAKIKKDKETKLDSHIKKYIPFFVMLLVLALIFVVLYLVFQGLGKIEYNGLTFTREKFGEVLVYSYVYLIKTPEGKIVQNTLYIRHDPRKNDIPIDGKVVYPAGQKVMVSINGTGLTECEDSMIAIATLTNFLTANKLGVKGGTPDKGEAKAKNMSYVSCDNYEGNAVVSIRTVNTNETKITREEPYCYRVDVANCEIQQAIEKFVVQSILDAKETSK